MICNILGKSVTVKLLFTYINHESRRLSRKARIRKTLVDFSVTPPLPLLTAEKDTLTQVFYCEFCEISKNTFLTHHLETTASGILAFTLGKNNIRGIH